VGALLLAVTLGCAVAAAPDLRAPQRWVVGGLASAGGAAVLRLIQPGNRLLAMMALGALLLIGVALLSWDWPDGRPDWNG
jgi:hypothetical protein